MQPTTPLLSGLVALLLMSSASASTTPAKPGAAVQIPPAPPTVAQRLGNQLLSAKLTSAQEMGGLDVGAGSIFGFSYKGIGDPANPKCVVRLRIERASNAIFPQPYTFSREYTLPEMNGQLETRVPSNDGGDWTFHFSTVQNCTGGPISFSHKVPFTPTQLEPKLHTLTVPGTQPHPTPGHTGTITIAGKGDLSNCKVELEFSAYILNGSPLSLVKAPSKRMISMNGNLSVKESFTVEMPPTWVPGFKPGSYHLVDVTLKPISGCTLLDPVQAAQGKMTATFRVWQSSK